MLNIKVEKRDLEGKKTHQLRKAGVIPAVIYNSKGDSHNVALPTGIAIKLVREATTTSIIDLDFDGKKVKALLKNVDLDPIREDIHHLAFFEIDESEAMIFDIPVVITGISPAVKNNLGILVLPTQSIEVKCMFKDLIPEIVVDVSLLTAVGQTVTVGDIKLPEGVNVVHQDQNDRALASITELQKTVEMLDEEAKSAADIAAETEEATAAEATEEEEAAK